MPGLSLVCLLILAQTPPPSGAQLRDQTQRTPLVGTGSLSGMVVGENGRPIKGARVSLGGGTVNRTEVSGATGEFVFEQLPEGRYSINASRQRYLSSSYGQKKPERSGTTIQLADAEHKKNLKITLFAGAVITGMVLGDDGEPVQNAQVRAMKYSMRTGVRRLQSSNSASTDDRGVYRLYGMTPGEYVISATSISQDLRSQMNVEMAVTMEVPAPVAFAPTYYPGATSPASAVSVTVVGGEERQGIDITLMKVQTATINGIVVSSAGAVPPSVSISLQPLDEAAQGMALSSARVTPDGRFTLRNVPPGQYHVVARATMTVRTESPAVGGQSFSTLQATKTGRTLVSVDGLGLNGVIVSLDDGRSVSGRVVFDGGMPPDLNRTRMTASLQIVPGSNTANPPQPAQVAADGTFKLTNVAPGRYTLRVSGAQNYSLKSSLVGGRDSLDYPFEVENDDVSDGLVTLAAGLVPSELGGTITDQASQPAVDYTIVVFSSDQRFWTPGSRRIVTARPATDGKYMLRGLPPGDYQIAALSDLEPGMQYDLEFLKTLLVASTRVTLGDGAKVTQDLRITIAVR